MRHVQRLGNQGRTRTLAGGLALVSGLSLFSVVHAPGAIGQLATVNVGNDGGAVASTGGNTATGNASTNNNNSAASSGGLLGGLVDADVSLGSATNTSTGTATINSGPAAASGNTSQTGVNQATTGGSNPAFTPFNPFAGTSGGVDQSATVNNSGDAAATSGGNTAVGNNSQNTIGSTQNLGLVDANVGLGGGPANNSSGTAAITTGAANAAGNTASNGVNQAHVTNSGGGGGGFGSGAGGGPGFFSATPFFPGTFPGTVNGFGSSFDPCSGRFLPFSPFFNDPSGQSATVNNDGVAAASTGGNSAIGNNSTNNAVINQTASGGLIGLNINLGSPTNNSTGTATINTGAANASGNQSSTTVNQFCGEVPGGGGGGGNQPFYRNPITGVPIVVPSIPVPVVVNAAAQTGTLARTGFESGMILVAAALVIFGMALMFTARRRLVPTGGAARVSSAEWDSVVRW